MVNTLMRRVKRRVLVKC